MKDVKRLISTGFWNDDKVLNDFSPEDKYFMLYLLSNPYTTQLGVYHLPLKKAALELGYSLEAVNALIDRFEKKYKIIRFNRETSEVAIKNYLVHSIVRGGKPVADCLEKDLKGIKDVSLVGFVINHISNIDNKNLNDTVIDFIKKHNDIHNDNDNDNERYVHESYHESSEMPKNQPKSKYGEFKHVLLSDRDMELLQNEYEDAVVTRAIKILDEYIEMKGAKYKNHYLALRKWAIDRAKKELQSNEQEKGQSLYDKWMNA